MDAEKTWYLLAAVFAAIAIVSGLGEYVFHWWREPGDWLSPASALLALLSLGWSASARDVRRLERAQGVHAAAMRARQEAMLARQDQTLAALERNTALLERNTAMLERSTSVLERHAVSLEELVRSFRGGPR